MVQPSSALHAETGRFATPLTGLASQLTSSDVQPTRAMFVVWPATCSQASREGET